MYKTVMNYDPKFSDRQVCTNSVEPDQTVPQEQFATPSALFGQILFGKSALFNFKDDYSISLCWGVGGTCQNF